MPFLEADPAVPPRRRARQRLLRPPHPGAVPGPVGGAEDQAHPALGHRAAQPRYPARRHRVPLGPAHLRRAQAQDLAVVRRARRGRSSRPSTRRASTRSPSCSTTRASTAWCARCSPSTATSTRSTCRGGRRSSPRSRASERPVRIGVVGKYVNLPDAYLSVGEALRHAGFHHGAKVEVDWIQAEKVPDLLGTDRMLQLDGMVIPGGLRRARHRGEDRRRRSYAREREIPCLGLCLGLQVMVIDVARHLAGLEGANSREFDTVTPSPGDRPHGRPAQRGRHGRHHAPRAPTSPSSMPGSIVAEAYGTTVVSERHRHRYEVNPRFRPRLEEAGLRVLGVVRRRRARRVRRAPRPPVLGRDPGPPRVQEPARPSPPAVPGARWAPPWRRAEGRLPRLIDIDVRRRCRLLTARAGFRPPRSTEGSAPRRGVRYRAGASTWSGPLRGPRRDHASPATSSATPVRWPSSP